MANLTWRYILYFTAISIALLAPATDGEKYSSKYDDINVDEILVNSRLRSQYVNCYLGTGPCVTSAARFLKEKFAEALFTKCRRCTDKQMIFFEKITEWFTKNDPETWNRAVQKAVRDARIKNE